MERPKLIALLMLCTVLVCGFFSMSRGPWVVAGQSRLVRPTRESKTDLEVSGAGLSRGFISYKDLLAMPQVAGTMRSDEDFIKMSSPSVPVAGVRLSVLARLLGVPALEDIILARCSDGYVGPFPAEYVAAHEPILVLKANGMTVEDWAKKTGAEDPGPYLVAYGNFEPAWKVLTHSDRRQVPDQVIELEFKNQKDVFGPITPPVRFGPGSPEQAGFAIAKQNCLRCHAAGPYGGTLGGLSWEALAGLAKRDGTRFARYVHDPKSVDPKAKMHPNPEYDDKTLAALTAYFRSQAK
jgi:hypothetical protein